MTDRAHVEVTCGGESVVWVRMGARNLKGKKSEGDVVVAGGKEVH